MSELQVPESWAKTSILETTTVEYCKGLTEANRKPGPYPVLASGGVVGRHNSFLYDRPLIVTGRKGSIGSVHIVEEPSWVIDTAFAIFPRPQLNINFLHNYLKSVDFAELEASTAIPSLSREALYKVEVPIPPLSEQRRIVAKIESTFKRIEAIEKAVEKAELLLTKYRESLLNKAFRGELVPQDPNDEPASKLLERIRSERAKQQDGKKKKKDDLPPITEDEIPFEIPKSWEWVRLGDLCVKIGSGQTPKGGNSVYKLDGVPLIRSQNVLNGILDLSDVAFIDRKVDEDMKGSRVFAGDVLYNITGGSIGRSCVIPAGFRNGNVNQHVLSIRPYFSNSNFSNFISLFLLSPFGKDFIFKNKKGAAREAITKAQIDSLIFPLPPESEINAIIFNIENLDQKIVNLFQVGKKLINDVSTLRNSILSAAFSGRLVPQDPSEGTGHQLLEQLLAAKANSDSTKAQSSKAKKRKSSK